jgi:hypothetical protein
MVDRHLRDIEIDDRGEHVETEDGDDGELGRGVDAGIELETLETIDDVILDAMADQDSAHDGADDDRGNREALHPAVRPDEFLGRQVLGENAVLCRRVHRRADPDEAVCEQGMHSEQHRGAADDFHGIADEHHLTLG